MTKEHISRDQNGDFTCVCGNVPWDNGFFACEECGYCKTNKKLKEKREYDKKQLARQPKQELGRRSHR